MRYFIGDKVVINKLYGFTEIGSTVAMSQSRQLEAKKGKEYTIIRRDNERNGAYGPWYSLGGVHVWHENDLDPANPLETGEQELDI